MLEVAVEAAVHQLSTVDFDQGNRQTCQMRIIQNKSATVLLKAYLDVLRYLLYSLSHVLSADA
jgi:hypothetical protein